MTPASTVFPARLIAWKKSSLPDTSISMKWKSASKPLACTVDGTRSPRRSDPAPPDVK